MPIDRFLQWGAETRDRDFSGRSLVSALYRSLLYGILGPLLRFYYRSRLALKIRGWTPFRQPRFRLLREVRSRYPRPFLLRLWLRSQTNLCAASDWGRLLITLHALKNRTTSLPWLLPEEALFAHSLDCKGFAVLLSTLLTLCGRANELWIGLPAHGEDGHAWVVIESEGGRTAVDQLNGSGAPEPVYLKEHCFAITLLL